MFTVLAFKINIFNMRVTTSQYERSGKNNAHLLSHNLPAGKKQFIVLEQAASGFWMFWYKRGCNLLGAIKEMALWCRDFLRRSLSKT